MGEAQLVAKVGAMEMSVEMKNKIKKLYLALFGD